jgi:hypothetical protein
MRRGTQTREMGAHIYVIDDAGQVTLEEPGIGGVEAFTRERKLILAAAKLRPSARNGVA